MERAPALRLHHVSEQIYGSSPPSNLWIFIHLQAFRPRIEDVACGTVRLYWDVKHFEGARTTLTALLEPGGREGGGGVIVFSGRHWRKNHSSHIVHEVKHLGAALLCRNSTFMSAFVCEGLVGTDVDDRWRHHKSFLGISFSTKHLLTPPPTPHLRRS